MGTSLDVIVSRLISRFVCSFLHNMTAIQFPELCALHRPYSNGSPRHRLEPKFAADIAALLRLRQGAACSVYLGMASLSCWLADPA